MKYLKIKFLRLNKMEKSRIEFYFSLGHNGPRNFEGSARVNHLMKQLKIVFIIEVLYIYLNIFEYIYYTYIYTYIRKSHPWD